MSVETTVAIAKPVINIRLFTIRIITAVSLFAVLGKANVWLDTATNSILALGYRALLLLLPLTLLVLGRRSLSVTLLCAALGLVLLAVTSNQGMVMFAAALFAYGIAIAGYLIKSEAAQTKEGAAYNRVAMNMGSLLAGLILLSPLLTPTMFFLGAAAFVLLCLPIAMGATFTTQAVVAHPVTHDGSGWRNKLPWVIAGIIMGIKLFGVFSILPQAILLETGELPAWYGLMLILNSAVVVFAQVPMMKLIERTGRFKVVAVIGIIVGGFAVLSSPAAFHVETLVGALIWVALLSLAECAFSYLDYFSVKQNNMFVKEVSLGVGAGLTVLIMRVVPPPYNALVLAAIGAGGILAWYYLNRKSNASLHD
ncbi:hypothetical protein SAMN04490185_2063 [Pseudomonas frederiksbergensis]|jgi:hypothetical protein|uniref:MFS transporter n=1 Tax=Pseudomonas frederiksbergensis TaxID=104087 RepID=A0A1H4V9S4_9PSED|nr:MULTISPECIES: hypothetical protein [Pseudomonas]PMU12332.1 hypothetical protein C1Y11_02505 [Pseudomonas sp. FW305-20]PMU19663.1 hypothetical protein C1Y10_08425 [Pseudomonas sp. FW305-122]PMU42675.1 hypothetical protein C1Y12_03910 [Pseudomonas sp. FW305-47B]PMX62211.1 hypothetical protein C1Y13_10115 [Pseudomonas sp. FW305-33]PMX69906.1 hypothetical protein C1X12_06275 [Pseudomonas sp. FW305-60]